MSLTALGLALMLVPSAHAQGGAGGGQGRGQRGRVSLATMPISAIDAIVTLTADEKTKVESIQAAYKTDAAAATGDRQKMRDVQTKATDDIKAALTTDQSAKLTETLPSVVLLAQSGTVPIKVLAAVKLTDEQWTKIKAAAKAATDKVAAAAQGQERQDARTAANAEFKTTVTALLTTEQKDIIAKAAPPAAPPADAAPKVL
jgi:hypothetical protein